MRGLLAFMVGLCCAGAAQAAEQLQVPELPGWKMVVSIADRAGETSEFIPESESNERWTRRATVQAFRGVPMTAAAFLEQVVQRTADVCDGATAGPVSLGKVSGAEAGTRTVACGRYKGDGKGSFTLHYVIRGREALYVVNRVWRGQPFNSAAMPIANSELAEWTDYVNAINLCDSQDPSHRCQGR